MHARWILINTVSVVYSAYSGDVIINYHNSGDVIMTNGKFKGNKMTDFLHFPGSKILTYIHKPQIILELQISPSMASSRCGFGAAESSKHSSDIIVNASWGIF